LSTVVSVQPVQAQKLENQQADADPDSYSLVNSPVAVSINHRFFKDGIYLYSQSANPNQIGEEYFVFEVHNKTVIGAFYMPHSSFDCFYGAVNAEALDLNIVNSYDQSTYPYSIKLQNYRPLAAVGHNDQRILSTCKASNQVQTISQSQAR
jgi:hypothetical protein